MHGRALLPLGERARPALSTVFAKAA